MINVLKRIGRGALILGLFYAIILAWIVVLSLVVGDGPLWSCILYAIVAAACVWILGKDNAKEGEDSGEGGK